MKLIIILVVSKLLYLLIKTFRKGTGTTWPGHIALKLYPNILRHPRFIFNKGVIVVAGTNGKTTTAKLCSHVLEGLGYKVLHNKSGGNILNGIVSTYINCTKLFRRFDYDFAVLEVDEFALPELLNHIHVDVLVLLNLSRDQLDRYGELDIIVEKWSSAITEDNVSNIVMYGSEKHFSPIKDIYKGNKYYFDEDPTFRKHTNLLGSFNSKNVNASVTACNIFGISKELIIPVLQSFWPAYGRGEIIEYFDKFYQVFLAKNPASFNHNLDIMIYSKETEVRELEYDCILFVLNDEIRDGRDVSWIYDINPVKLSKACLNKTVFVSGLRAYDMALRLHYAGVEIDNSHVDPSLKHTIDKIHQSVCKNIIVLPNYSSMLQFRGLTLGKEIL